MGAVRCWRTGPNSKQPSIVRVRKMSDKVATANKAKGKVKFFNKTKGFGFIVAPGEVRDVFFHFSDLPEGVTELLPDQMVAYVREEVAKGPRARKIEIVA